MSTAESFAYRPTGSGHEGEPRRKKAYTGPQDRLYSEYSAFREWMDIRSYKRHSPFDAEDEVYKKVVSMIPDISDMPIEDINALAVLFEGNSMGEGLFLSAAHAVSPHKDIVYSGDGKLNFLGYSLPKDKILLVRSGAESVIGAESRGTIVNYSDSNIAVGSRSRGVFINFGRAANDLGGSSEFVINFSDGVNRFGATGQGNILISTERVENFMGSNPYHWYGSIDSREVRELKHLKPYLENLKDAVGPHRSDDDVFSFLRENDVRAEVTRLVRKENRRPRRLVKRVRHYIKERLIDVGLVVEI